MGNIILGPNEQPIPTLLTTPQWSPLQQFKTQSPFENLLTQVLNMCTLIHFIYECQWNLKKKLSNILISLVTKSKWSSPSRKEAIVDFLEQSLIFANLYTILYWVLLFVFFKVAVFASGVDTSATETKGTVLIHTAEQVYQNDKSFEFDYYSLLTVLYSYIFFIVWVVKPILCLLV